jgi:transglutaminase-like putative cysteine protease
MAAHYEKYLRPTYFIDFDNPLVIAFTENNCDPSASRKDKAIQLYYAIRDNIIYDPYDLQPERNSLQASSVVKKMSGYCVAKAVLLAAVYRQQNIPARLGFADVTNHLSTRKLREIMGTDLFIYHGYTEVFLNEKWVKATPAFNLSLCQRFNVKSLEFDGNQDSLFHEFDSRGQKHMENVFDHGYFADLPFARIFTAYEEKYPGMFERFKAPSNNNFSKEAEEDNR